jgi:predicted membrane-bound spermidine synthase
MSGICDYIENDRRLGVTYVWKDAVVEHRQLTRRGTLVEMVRRPRWGVACFMDGTIQSCESDEKIYHEALTRPILELEPKSVCILGGGEGATAREILSDPFIGRVDMIEWDEDVVELFSGPRYFQWAADAFKDPRLKVEYIDVFKACRETRTYDAVIIDLFEPEEMAEDGLVDWIACLTRVFGWARMGVSIYAGMSADSIGLLEKILHYSGFDEVGHYRVYVPSFMGEAHFVWGRRAAAGF